MGNRAAAAGAGAHLNRSPQQEAVPGRGKRLRNALLLAPVALFPFVLMGALFLFRSTGIKRAAADTAIYAAQRSAAVTARLGQPVEPGWPVRGTVAATHGNGTARLRIPLSGPNGRAELVEWAEQRGGRWTICSLTLESAAGQAIVLVDGAGGPGSPCAPK